MPRRPDPSGLGHNTPAYTPQFDNPAAQKKAAAIYEETRLRAYAAMGQQSLARLKLVLTDDLERRADQQLMDRCLARQMAAPMCDELTRWQLAQNQQRSNLRAQQVIDMFVDPFGLG